MVSGTLVMKIEKEKTKMKRKKMEVVEWSMAANRGVQFRRGKTKSHGLKAVFVVIVVKFVIGSGTGTVMRSLDSKGIKSNGLL